MNGIVVAVARGETHTFGKKTRDRIKLLAGLGVEEDAHFGKQIQHRSRLAKDPMQPNLRQVHLIQSELFEEMRGRGFEIVPGEMGENVTTKGIDLLALPTGARLHLGETAIVTLTGLRNPCAQIDHFQKGLLAAVVDHDKKGNLIRKAGVMAIVEVGGEVKAQDAIEVDLPRGPHAPLQKV